MLLCHPGELLFLQSQDYSFLFLFIFVLNGSFHKAFE